MLYTFLKPNFIKEKRKFINYRCLKNFSQVYFEKILYEDLRKICNSFEEFYDTFSCTLDCFAPLKKKKNCANHNKFIAKDLRKAIMNRSRLRNKFNQNCTSEN